jgi:hypothetical protein
MRIFDYQAEHPIEFSLIVGLATNHGGNGFEEMAGETPCSGCSIRHFMLLVPPLQHQRWLNRPSGWLNADPQPLAFLPNVIDRVEISE